MNFDEMDIEPKDEVLCNRKSPPLEMSSSKINEPEDEELQMGLLLRTVPLEDGCNGYVFTCTKNGPSKLWRCHVCNFIDTWTNLLKHIELNWHKENMTKFRHSRSNFTKIENAIPDISKGQPLPPGMEDEYTGPCYILKTLETFDQPLIGLEFLLELHVIDLKEPRYLCLLCDKRGDPRSIMVHLTSQNHYILYLRKYFRKFHSLIDQLPKSNECRSNVAIVTSHLISKLEEKYGRLQPTATHDILSSPEQRAVVLQKIDHGEHFTESPDDVHLEAMLTVEYVQNTTLLLKDFPLKPKVVKSDTVEKKVEENSKSTSLFNKSSKPTIKKQLRNRDGGDRSESREKSPDVVFVGSQKLPKQDYKDRPDRFRERSPRSRSRHRSRSIERERGERRRYVSPSYYRSLRYHHSRSRSRSPRRYRSRSPDSERDRFGRRISPHSKYISRQGYHHSPERYGRSSSPLSRSLYYRSKDRSRSRSPRGRDRSPRPRIHKSGSRSGSGTRPGLDGIDKILGTAKEKFEGGPKFAYLRELKEVEKRLKKELERYTETAEDHPAYQDEWKKFWCARYKELQDEGKEDPRKYDFKPEWITFWNVRIKELHEEELEEQKKLLKTKYALENEPVKPKKSNDKQHSSSEDNKPVVDIKTMWKELTGFEIRENSSSKRKSLSPWEEDNEEENDGKDDASGQNEKKSRNNVLDDRNTRAISPKSLSPISDTESLDGKSPLRRGRSRSFSKSRSRSPPGFFAQRPPTLGEAPRKKKIHFENPLNIITVLRQLSVLEYQLGSYSGHVVSLLSSGLAMERIKPQSSVDLLTKENVIFLELVKEKLKGQLLAGVVQKSMVKATLFCIKNIEELLLLVPKLKPTAPPPVPQPPPALLYGAGVDSYPGTAPPTAPSHSYGSHGYGNYVYKQHTPRPYKPYSDRYPLRKSPPKRPEDQIRHGAPERYHTTPNRYPFRPETPFKDFSKERQPPITSSGSTLPSNDINKALIAGQIAEALEQQGRTDVSEEELSVLVNTVVESLQSGKKGSAIIGDILAASSSSNASTTMPTTSMLSSKTVDVPTIPVGFNVNDVPNATLALLQDAFKNAAALPIEKPFNIEELPESELIQLLRNFKSIPRMKQEKLIEYLRKLEDTNPERVEELKKYVNEL